MAEQKEGLPRPRLIVVCGVSGSGKSTLAAALADRLGWRCLDADDFHSAAARERMAAGRPLDDDWRAPWIAAITECLRRLAGAGEDVILAYSALKPRYREPLRHCGYRCLFLLLCVSRERLQARLAARRNHFMAPKLLDSQLRALELVADEPDLRRMDGDLGPAQLCDRAMAVVTEQGFVESGGQGTQ